MARTMKRSMILPAAVALIAAAYTGCGGDDEQASKEKTATTTETTDTIAEQAKPDVKNLRCRDVEFGHTSTDTVFLVSAVAGKAGTDIERAANAVELACDKAKPNAKAYPLALSELR